MAEGPSDPFLVGVLAGVARAERHNLRPVDVQPELFVQEHVQNVLGEPVALARRCIERQEASERFTEFFGEMVAVATLARHAYGEAALSEAEMEAYLAQAFSFFNSFRHT